MQSFRLLIADDDADVRFLVRTRLRREQGMEVVGEAENGVEAVRLVTSLTPSAVVLDMQMPEMTGLEAIPLMRAAAPGMPIVIFTADAAADLPKLEEAAPDAIVRKGVSLDELVRQLRLVLAAPST